MLKGEVEDSYYITIHVCSMVYMEGKVLKKRVFEGIIPNPITTAIATKNSYLYCLENFIAS